MDSLPSGTVTFLFTDIEGSTRLWAQHPDAMRVALAKHDAQVRHAIEAHGGHVFKTIGDAFCAAFATADDALAAVVAAQKALHAEAWDAATPIRVRCALHSGIAEQRDDDYFGPVLNFCARLLSAAHGGQTVVSRVTCDLMALPVPDGATLRDLGTVRLRDIAGPEHVFQLVHPALPADFPPLAGITATPHNLPLEPNPFVGRRAEVEAIQALLERSALVTLVGPGGAGKTRLALHLAAERLDAFPDGVWLVELAPLADPALVPQAAATALQVRETPGTPVRDTLIEHLRTRRLALVLDNCEHVVDACARLADAILKSCPGVTLLATSREALTIAAEVVFHLPPLSVPPARLAISADPDAAVAAVVASEAGQLFVARASDASSAFALTPANAAAVAAICRRLDGLALAIELAAARVRMMAPEQIAARLDDHLRILTSGRRDTDARQQTMRGAIDWSYRLLAEPERALLNRLAVFAGGWTLEMAEALCAGGPIEDWEVLDLMTGLVDKSLVATAASGSAQRYRLYETIRQFALEQLATSGEAERLRDAHLDWCIDFACGAQTKLHGPEQAEWLDRIEAEHDNCRSALAWALASGAAESGLRLGAELWFFWYMRGYLGEGRQQLGVTLALAKSADVGVNARVQATKALGALAYYQGDYPAARAAWEESLALARAGRCQPDVGKLLNNLGSLQRALGDYGQARRYFAEGLDVMRALGDRSAEAGVRYNLALVAYEEGRLAEAKDQIEACLVIQRPDGDPFSVAQSLCTLAGVEFSQGDFAAADVHGAESLVLYRAAGTEHGAAAALEVLARVACERGDLGRAKALWGTRLEMLRDLGDTQGVANTLIGLGLVHVRDVALDQAAATLDEGLALARQVTSRPFVAEALLHRCQLWLARDEPDLAAADLREAMEIGRDLGSSWIVTRAIERLIALLVARGDAEAALTMASAADVLRDQGEAPRPPAIAAEIEGFCFKAHDMIEPPRAEAAAAAGRAMDLASVLDFALARLG